MNFAKLWKSVLAAVAVIAVVFIFVILLDAGLSIFYNPTYSHAAFIFSFGVGGIFAAVFAFFYGIQLAPMKNNHAKWTLITLMIAIGLLIFFFISKLEEGEYETAFKAFGATLTLGSLLFMNFDPKN